MNKVEESVVEDLSLDFPNELLLNIYNENVCLWGVVKKPI